MDKDKKVVEYTVYIGLANSGKTGMVKQDCYASKNGAFISGLDSLTDWFANVRFQDWKASNELPKGTIADNIPIYVDFLREESVQLFVDNADRVSGRKAEALKQFLIAALMRY